MATQSIPDTATRHAIDLFVERVSGRYAIDQVWLYGSRARGDATLESDADVALVLDGPERRAMDVGLEMAEQELEVLMETGILVQAMPVYRDAWNDPSKHNNPYLIANIKRDGIVIQ